MIRKQKAPSDELEGLEGTICMTAGRTPCCQASTAVQWQGIVCDVQHAKPDKRRCVKRLLNANPQVPKQRRSFSSLLALVLASWVCGYAGSRIGEAANPGPCDFDNPEGDDIWEADDQLEMPWQLPDVSDVGTCRDEAWPDGPGLVEARHDAGGSQPRLSGTLEGWHSHPDYVPARKFRGERLGMVFKKGALGIGYYLDAPDTVIAA